MATALILFTQGANTDVAGKAVLGEVNEAVTVTNGSNTGVVSWKLYLLDAPPDSATFPPGSQPQILAQAVDNTPTVDFTPDVPGTYRIMLEVTDASSIVDRDIRCFGIPDARGFVRPPYQQNPEPLPLQLPGIITREPRPIKPDEQNYGANVRGWSGNGDAGQLDAFFRRYADLPSTTVTSTPYSATEADAPLLLIDTSSIGGPATVNLPLSPRIGFVARIATLGAGFAVTIQAQGGGEVGGVPSLQIRGGGIVLIHDGGNEWALLSISSADAGGVEPLSNVLYVDLNTTAVTQDGSIGAPFDTVTAAIAAASSGDVLIITAGDYSSEGALTIGKDITLRPTAPIPMGVAGLSSFFNGAITIGDVTMAAGCTGFFHGINIGTLDLADSASGAVVHGCSVSVVTGDGTVVGYTSNLTMPFEGLGLVANNCQISVSGPGTIDLSGEVCDLSHCQVAGGAVTITFTGDPGEVRYDDYTAYWIREVETQFGFSVVNGTQVVLSAAADPPERLVVLAGSQSTDQTTFQTVGAFNLSAAESTTFASPSFRVTAFTTNAADACEVRLFNQTTSAPVASSTLSFTNTDPAELDAGLTLPAGENLYLVQMRLATTGTPNEAVCLHAQLIA